MGVGHDYRRSRISSCRGIAITVLVMFIQPFLTQERIVAGFEWAKSHWIGLSLAVVVAGLVIVAIKQRLDKRKLQAEIQTLSDKVDRQEPRKFQRFENIDKIVYGHIEYDPLFGYDPRTDTPKGIGIRLIEEIFGKTAIIKYPKRGLWEDLVTKLSEGEYDIVATPLYETHARSRLVSFCSPIFFSDIGIYVKADSELFKGRKDSSFEDIPVPVVGRK